MIPRADRDLGHDMVEIRDVLQDLRIRQTLTPCSIGSCTTLIASISTATACAAPNPNLRLDRGPKRNNNNHSPARPASGSAIISETRGGLVGIGSHPVDHLMSLGHPGRAAPITGAQRTAAGKVIYLVGAPD